MPDQVQVNDDGSVCFPPISRMPPSELISPEFRAAYVRFLRWMSAYPPLPAIDSSRDAWDAFDAAANHSLDEDLARARSHHPVTIEQTLIGGIRVAVITPAGGIAPGREDRVLINLHGGGFVAFRGLAMALLESIPLAAIAGTKVVAVDYRHTPFARHPAAVEDAAAVYAELVKVHRPDAIGIFGTSAGGALAGQLLAWAQANDLPRPGAVGVFWASPDPSFFVPAHAKRGDSALWAQAFPSMPDAAPSTPEIDVQVTRSIAAMNWYMAQADLADPKAFPVRSDATLSNFPPTLIVTGTRAFDMSAAITAHARLLRAGVDAALYVMEGGWHGAEQFAIGTDEQRHVDRYKAVWFDRHLAA